MSGSPHAAAGHPGRYKDCTHPDCRTYRNRYLKRYTHETRDGVRRTTDTTAVTSHLQQLRDLGWSLRAIAGAADSSASVVSRLVSSDQDRILTSTAARFLAIDPTQPPSRPSKQTTEPFVPAEGARRRIRALLWMGWGYPQMTAHSGIANPAAILHQKGRWITRTTHDKVAAMYDALAMRQGPSAKAQTWARKQGYAPPLAWDDIDNDPAPLDSDADPGEIDAVAIQRRMAGDKSVPLTDVEREHLVALWAATGRSWADFEKTTGVNPYRHDRSAVA